MFNLNEIVRVKPNTQEPDFKKSDLGGWQGRVIEINAEDPDEILLLIEWDTTTLKNMDKIYIKACIREGYDYESMWLDVSDVISVTPSAETDNRSAVVEALEAEYHWEDLGEQGERIKAVEDACKNDLAIMDHWLAYLESNVTLPVAAKYVGDGNRSISFGAVININGFADTNDIYGVVGAAKYQKRSIQVLLCDIEILNLSPENQALDDYIVWFANR
jgi:hypothetical protein